MSPVDRRRDIRLLLINTAIFFALYNALLTVFPLFVVFRGGTEQEVGILVGLFSLSAVASRIYLTRIAEGRGRKWLLGVAVLTTITGPLLYLPDLGFWYLALVRMYHAASLGAFMTASYTLLADYSDESNRGQLFGLYGVVSGVAMAIAPALGYAVIDRLGYNAFLAGLALVGLLMIPGHFLLREPQVQVEAEDPTSGLFQEVLRNRWVLVSSFAVFLVTMALGALTSFLPLHATSRGISELGPYFAVFSLMYMAGGYGAGVLSDRWGRKIAAAPAFLFVVIGLVILTQLSGFPLLLVAGLFFGLGFGGLNTALMALVMDHTSLAQRSQAVSFYNNSFDLGSSGGAILLGGIAALSFGLLWTLLAGVSFLGFALICFALPRQ